VKKNYFKNLEILIEQLGNIREMTREFEKCRTDEMREVKSFKRKLRQIFPIE